MEEEEEETNGNFANETVLDLCDHLLILTISDAFVHVFGDLRRTKRGREQGEMIRKRGEERKENGRLGSDEEPLCREENLDAREE